MAEDVASHSHLVSLIALGLVLKVRECGLSVDGEKALAMAVIHDVPEAVTGDLPRPVKERLGGMARMVEEDALLQLGLGGLLPLYRELEDSGSVESILVRVADDLATYLRGVYYLSQGYRDVADIVENTRLSAVRLAGSLPEGYRECVVNYINELLENTPRGSLS
ncbi:MAG: HD domain-containing protein [Thermogladius sp.]|nr:HD domain-containing protein [Thermogladius sp.]